MNLTEILALYQIKAFVRHEAGTVTIHPFKKVTYIKCREEDGALEVVVENHSMLILDKAEAQKQFISYLSWLEKEWKGC